MATSIVASTAVHYFLTTKQEEWGKYSEYPMVEFQRTCNVAMLNSLES